MQWTTRKSKRSLFGNTQDTSTCHIQVGIYRVRIFCRNRRLEMRFGCSRLRNGAQGVAVTRGGALLLSRFPRRPLASGGHAPQGRAGAHGRRCGDHVLHPRRQHGLLAKGAFAIRQKGLAPPLRARATAWTPRVEDGRTWLVICPRACAAHNMHSRLAYRTRGTPLGRAAAGLALTQSVTS